MRERVLIFCFDISYCIILFSISLEHLCFASRSFDNTVKFYISKTQVSFLRRGFDTAETYDADEISQVFLQNFSNQIFSVKQPLCFDFHGVNLHIVVTTVEVANLHDLQGTRSVNPTSKLSRGILSSQTAVIFSKAPDSTIKLKGSTKNARPNALLAPNFNFEDLGIGGLDKEFSAIFRRAFASRCVQFSPSWVFPGGDTHIPSLPLS